MSQVRSDEGRGWITFAGVIFIIVGVLNVFQGLLLIANDEIYVTGPDAQVVVVGDVTTWGWVILIVGVLQWAAGYGVFYGQQWARWVGIIIASLALVAQFPVFFGPNPVWSFLVALLSALIIYALAVYGDRSYA